MAQLAAAAPYLMAGGAAVSAYSAIRQGRQLEMAANLEARQMDMSAKAEAAISQRVAESERKKARLLQSRVKALAAASGAGASDPTIIDIMGDIEREGEIRALDALYEGRTAAEGLRFASGIRRREGREGRRAGTISAVGDLFSAGGSIASRYQ